MKKLEFFAFVRDIYGLTIWEYLNLEPAQQKAIEIDYNTRYK